MEPPARPHRGLHLPGVGGNTSPIIKIGATLAGLLLIVIIFAIAKSLFSGGGNTAALTTVAQNQQSMIHIIENGPGADSQQQAPLSDNTQNFAATADASLNSAQQQLIQYMKNNGKKVSLKTLNLKIDSAIDQQLTTAAGNSTYESTFKQVMQSQLVNYEKSLRAAYQQTSGPKGRALLSQEFDGAQLLLQELNMPPN